MGMAFGVLAVARRPVQLWQRSRYWCQINGMIMITLLCNIEMMLFPPRIPLFEQRKLES